MKEDYQAYQKRMEAAFSKVQNATNWKNPINKKIAVANDTFDKDVSEIREAVTHFTGGVCHIKVGKRSRETTMVTFVAPGYYVSVGA